MLWLGALTACSQCTGACVLERLLFAHSVPVISLALFGGAQVFDQQRAVVRRHAGGHPDGVAMRVDTIETKFASVSSFSA
jgi:hypothetical protein